MDFGFSGFLRRCDCLTKNEARIRVREWKKSLEPEYVMRHSECILKRLYLMEQYKNAGVLYTYVSYNQEVDTHPLIKQAIRDGKRVAVPKVIGNEMHFFYIETLEQLVSGYQGILEPSTSVEAKDEEILMILPGLAFDATGTRIGYGKGFYDRYLEHNESSRIYNLVCTFDYQVVSHLEADPWDIKVDAIITETRTIICKNK